MTGGGVGECRSVMMVVKPVEVCHERGHLIVFELSHGRCSALAPG